MITAAVTGQDRLAARLIARAGWLAGLRLAAARLPPGALWRRADWLWPPASSNRGD